MTINFVLCNASLELRRERSAKRRSLPQSFTLLNEEEHYREPGNTNSSKGDEDENDDDDDIDGEQDGRPKTGKRRNWKEVRPDILHFCLLALQDSILNKEGHIAIWVHTLNSQVYRIYPEFRIPRTFKVFNKVMAKYLHSNARSLKPEGDDSTILVERTNKRLEELGDGGVKIAVSSRGKLIHCGEFLDKLAKDLTDSWIFISLSNYTSLPVPDESGVLCVADVCNRLLERSNKTPEHPNYSQDVERMMINGNLESVISSSAFHYNVSISRSYPSAMSTCYKLACAIERLIGL